MKFVFIDLETSGLPKQPNYKDYYSYHETKYYDSSRVVQIAILIYEHDESTQPNAVEGSLEHISSRQKFNLIKEHNIIIKPDNFVINNSEIHGIQHEIAAFSGVDFKQAVGMFINDIKDASLLIAHNVLFDRNILASEMSRYGLKNELEIFTSIPTFCTSRGCKNITKIKFNIHEYKQPKLKELFKFLFKYEPSGLHDALQDTRILCMCFFELLNKNLLKLSM